MTLTTPIKNLKQHPAQMRTVYDVESMATLCLQVYERGLDEWQTLLASPNGQATPDGVATYFIVSGHRRQMARLLAWALADWATDHPDREISVEVARTMIATLVNSLGSLQKVIAALLEKYGDREIPVALFEGSQKAEILSLQAANYGSEQADMMGIAHSFRQAVEAGATPEEIGRNCGQNAHYVHNHLALTDIPPELAQRIAAGELPMSVARTVADMPEPKRGGLSVFILANPSASSGQASTLTAKAIKKCASVLKQWPGLQLPLVVKHQTQRNIARALTNLWQQVAAKYPEDAYSAAAMLIYRDLHEDPWVNKERLTFWFQALGGDVYFNNGSINWTAVTDHLLPEVTCETCPIAQLPAQLLRADLGMTCRTGQKAVRCLHGLAANDPFDVRVPWEWSEYPIVINAAGEYRVKSYDDLLSAWHLQAEAEKKGDAGKEVVGEKETGREQPSTANNHQPTPNNQSPAADSQPPNDGPIVKQRALIANYMKRHEQLAATHPFATPCASCRHRLTASPTKDDSVPHCAWAGRLRKTAFKVLEPDDKSAPRIPVCRQFAPEQPWNEIIPAHPNTPEAPRAWLKEQILHLAKDSNRYGSERNSFEFLTGRPMRSSDNYGDWFQQQLAAQGGELSQEQLYTLFIWAHVEWRRPRGRGFSLPVNGSGSQFAIYQEKGWQVKRDED